MLIPGLCLGQASVQRSSQEATPASTPASVMRNRVVTAAERSGLIDALMGTQTAILIDTVDGRPVRVALADFDSVGRRIARQWAEKAVAAQPRGIQLDAVGDLYALGKQPDAAQRVFDQRLADRTLTPKERLYTLELAISSFALVNLPDTGGAEAPELKRALPYVHTLDTLSTAPNTSRFDAHWQLGYAYLLTGQRPAGVAEFRRALDIGERISWWERGYYMQQFRDIVWRTGQLAYKDSSYRRLADSVFHRVRGLMQAGPADLAYERAMLANGARDSMITTNSVQRVQAIDMLVKTLALLGKPSPDIIATHWYVSPAPALRADEATPGARKIALGDGKVHVIEFGGMDCPACLIYLKQVMVPIYKQFGSQVDMWYFADAEQRWGATECTPDEAAEHVRKFYQGRHKITNFPIGVWSPVVDDSTTDPGAKLMRADPSRKALNISTVPVVVVVDADGIIRSRGGMDIKQMRQFLSELLAEAKRAEAKRTETKRTETKRAETKGAQPSAAIARR